MSTEREQEAEPMCISLPEAISIASENFARVEVALAAEVERDAAGAEPDLEYTCPPCWVRDCTCGSGGHPRRCERHPERFAEHCRELTDEWCVCGETSARNCPVHGQ